MFSEYINKKEAEDFNEQLVESTKGQGQLTQIGLSDGEQVFKFVMNPDGEKTICFIAGLHGDEKGGPYGVLEYIKSKPYVPKNKRLVIIPLANPYGFKKDIRRNVDGIDMNRHFMDEKLEGDCKMIWDNIKDDEIKFLHTLHEDPRLKTWYCYHIGHKQLAEDLRDLAKKYFAIFGKSTRKPLKDDEAEDCWGDKIYHGLIPDPISCKNTIEDKFYIDYSIPYITTETPGMVSMKKRTDYNKAAMKLVVSSL